ncbi:MAG: PH domain-containing protein [Chloroflexi bacterium]|nr:PH domain-containing protein [Chloroflexota bacterium]
MTQEPERTIKTWRRSTRNPSFWLITIVTLGLYVVLVWQHNDITLTTRRVTQRRGNILTSNETSISLPNVTDVNVNRSALGKLLGYGDISIQSAGSSAAEVQFVAVANPTQIREAIFDLRDGRLDEERL